MSGGMELYLHIPFCEKKCAYCDFLSFPSGKEIQRQYAKRLMEDIDSMGKEYGDIPVDTIFIGGGTPSVPGISSDRGSYGACEPCISDQ